MRDVIHNNELGDWLCGCCGSEHEPEMVWVPKVYGPETERQAAFRAMVRAVWGPVVRRQIEDVPLLERLEVDDRGDL